MLNTEKNSCAVDMFLKKGCAFWSGVPVNSSSECVNKS